MFVSVLKKIRRCDSTCRCLVLSFVGCDDAQVVSSQDRSQGSLFKEVGRQGWSSGEPALKIPLCCCLCLAESQSVEECGERLKRILESPSIPQANHQLLVHLSRHLARVSQLSQTGPRLLGQAFAEAVFKHSALRYAGFTLHCVFLAGKTCFNLHSSSMFKVY